MSNFTEYKGKKAIIYDESNKKTLGETVVLEFDRNTQIIVVDSRRFDTKNLSHVSVLILSESGVYEYQGMIRHATDRNRLSIALYSGKVKENRKNIRYTVHSPAVIEHVVISHKPVPLAVKREVEVVNISASGILVRGGITLFNIGTTFQIRLPIAGETVLINATVVRIQHIDYKTSEYGCKMNFRCA